MASKGKPAASIEVEFERMLTEIEKHRKGVDRELLHRAYLFSAKAHEGQWRLSGDPYLSHCVAVALILAELHLDSITIACGLLHDIVEDTPVGIDEVRREFGTEIADIVDGVTHISGLSFDTPEKRQMENYRKMLISMAKDVRVILVKLADRLHNMRTLQYLPEKDRRRISKETLDVFAPLAHRLGIAKIKWELEDLSLKFLDPEAYEYLSKQIDQSREEREKYIEEFSRPLLQELKANGVNAEITGRAKHFYSIYMKMKKQGRPIEDIYDLLAIRVITESVQDCYKALGIIHSIYTPVIDRIKDFIARPKENMYRSLHTTVIDHNGQDIEIQIRTREMHKTAEEGIAAHWKYKEGGKSDKELDKQLSWLRQTLEWLTDMTDPKDFMHSLKADLYHNEIFAFTPKGDVKNLPAGATPIDFAYAVHTEVGHKCVGAKVNGKLVPLDYELKNGDVVEILTQAGAEPSIDWLKIVKTSNARSRIKRWLKSKGYKESVILGRELLEREFRKHRKHMPSERELDDIAQTFGRSDCEHLLASVGAGEISSQQVVKKVHPEEPKVVLPRKPRRQRTLSSGVRIEGVGKIMIRFAKCCHPVPGDRIVGLVTTGRGVSVHRSGCPNVLRLGYDNERIVQVHWDAARHQAFPVCIYVVGEDRKSMLADVAKAISDENANILTADIRSESGYGIGTFEIEVHNLNQLERVLGSISAVKGVLRVTRKGEVKEV